MSDPKITTTEHVTPEDLTDDLLDVDPGPRPPVSKRAAQELAKVNLRNTLSQLEGIMKMFHENLRLYDAFSRLSRHAGELFEQARWYDDVNKEWVEVQWDKDEDHIVYALLEKYEESFIQCGDFESVFRELKRLHTILTKVTGA